MRGAAICSPSDSVHLTLSRKAEQSCQPLLMRLWTTRGLMVSMPPKECAVRGHVPKRASVAELALKRGMLSKVIKQHQLVYIIVLRQAHRCITRSAKLAI